MGVLQDALEELSAALGEGIVALSARRPLVRRRVTVTDPPRYNGDRVRSIRRKVGATQVIFAEMLGVSPSTLRAWEQGLKAPSALARRMLQMVEDEPDLTRQWVSIDS